MYNQFENIKVGDKVLIHTWCGSWNMIHKYVPSVVEKVTKATFKISDSSHTFNKSGGVRGGDGWERINIIPYDEEFYKKWQKESAEENKRKELLSKIGGIEFKMLTTDQLEKICEICGK